MFYLYPDVRKTLAQSRFSAALELTRNGHYESAEKLYQELIRSDPDSLWFNYALAENMEYQQRLAEASRLYKATLLLYPDDIAIAARLVNVLIIQGQPKSALGIARQLFDQHKNQPRIHQLLVTIYKELNDEPLRKLAEADYHWFGGNKKHAKRLYKMLLDNGELGVANEEGVNEKLGSD